MGGGGYSTINRSVRADYMGYQTKSRDEIFQSRSINEGMNPLNIGIRESRDSAEHPNSVAIIIGLDVTGSMGYIPHALVKDGLPTMMASIIERGIKDPQVMFCAIGDSRCDRAPFQISQFESNDEMLDHWLTSTYLEGGGGGNGGEDYSFVHHFASNHTSIDCFEKRGEKGFLFTIGDDKPHSEIYRSAFKQILGESESTDKKALDMIKEAQKTYHVYHIHVASEASSNVKNTWRNLLGENFIDCTDHNEVPKIIAQLVADNSIKYGQYPISSTNQSTASSTEEMML